MSITVYTNYRLNHARAQIIQGVKDLTMPWSERSITRERTDANN